MSESVFEYDPLTPKAKKSGFLSGTCSKRKGAGVGAARPDNVIEANTGETTFASAHGATFPLGLPTFFIKAYSDPSDSIFDPFLGSGTTMIAAEREGRIAYGTEISPKYVAVILQRAKDAGMQPRRLNV